jgi:hypothetical protein
MHIYRVLARSKKIRVYLKLGNLFQPEAGSFFVGLGACGCPLLIFKIFVSLKWHFPHFGSNFEQM